MKANQLYLRQSLDFWANIKLISQKGGYTDKATKTIKIHSLQEIKAVYEDNNLDCSKLISKSNEFTSYGKLIVSYLKYRSEVLNDIVEPNLMKVAEAKATFEKLMTQLKPTCPLPKNKQTGDKAGYAYLTGIVNMIVENNSRGFGCDYDPRELTAFTKNGFPIRTLSRRVDGAFPGIINPKAIWEIKEYYFTTTFGSRVADGVYETMLDGMELREINDNLKIDVEHYLIVDDHFTWWVKGKSYLCRIIDMLHMGILTQVLFGKEILTELPLIIQNLTKK